MVNRGEEKVRVQMNVVPRGTMNTNDGTENKLFHHLSIRLAWTLSLKSFCKTPVVDEKGWFLEVESQLGKSFKVSR